MLDTFSDNSAGSRSRRNLLGINYANDKNDPRDNHDILSRISSRLSHKPQPVELEGIQKKIDHKTNQIRAKELEHNNESPPWNSKRESIVFLRNFLLKINRRNQRVTPEFYEPGSA